MFAEAEVANRAVDAVPIDPNGRVSEPVEPAAAAGGQLAPMEANVDVKSVDSTPINTCSAVQSIHKCGRGCSWWSACCDGGERGWEKCRQYTHKHMQRSTVYSQARNASHALGSRIAREKYVPHVSHPLLLSHLPFTTSTLSSSFTLPCTTTPEHALQSGQHDLLQEHQYIMNLSSPVDKQRHQESLWRENLQSGGNPRSTPSTGYEPKELPTVSRISRITDPYQLHDAQKEFGEEDHRVPIIEEVKRFGGFGTHGLRDVYTHSPFARTFFCAQRTLCVLRTSSCVSHTRMAQVRVNKVCLAHVSYFSISASPVS